MGRRATYPLRAGGRIVLSAVVCAVGATDLSAQTLEGRLLDAATGEPIPTGLVIMMTEEGDSVGSTLSDEKGRFSISSPDAGSFFLLASAWGYEESMAGIFELGDDGVMTLEYGLAPAPLPIEKILVELDAGEPLPPKVVSSGFVRRMQRGLGHFVTPYDIENAVDTKTTDLLNRLPGVFASYPSNIETYVGASILLQGPVGRCSPRFYLDGIFVEPQVSIDGLVPLSDLEAVEIYRRPAQIPVEYGMGGRASEGDAFNPCGVVLFWTKAG